MIMPLSVYEHLGLVKHVLFPTLTNFEAVNVDKNGYPILTVTVYVTYINHIYLKNLVQCMVQFGF